MVSAGTRDDALDFGTDLVERAKTSRVALGHAQYEPRMTFVGLAGLSRRLQWVGDEADLFAKQSGGILDRAQSTQIHLTIAGLIDRQRFGDHQARSLRSRSKGGGVSLFKDLLINHAVESLDGGLRRLFGGRPRQGRLDGSRYFCKWLIFSGGFRIRHGWRHRCWCWLAVGLFVLFVIGRNFCVADDLLGRQRRQIGGGHRGRDLRALSEARAAQTIVGGLKIRVIGFDVGHEMFGFEFDLGHRQARRPQLVEHHADGGRHRRGTDVACE